MPKGFQDNNTISVDVVYTKIGRYYKSVGSNLAVPVKVAFSDDGVDYNQYNENLVEAERGLAIERMPVLDAWTEESALMKNKLLTLPRQSTDVVSAFTLNQSTWDLTVTGANNEFRNNTISINANFATPNGFKITLKDYRYFYINNPPTGNYTATGRDGTYLLDEVVNLPTNNSGQLSQVANIQGSNVVPFVARFDIVYNSKYNRFTSTTPYTTVVTVESLDGGFREDITINLTKSS